MTKFISEDDIEKWALDTFSEMGYDIINGVDIAPPPDGKNPERKSYYDVVLVDRLTSAIKRLNPRITEDAREQALKEVLRASSPKLINDNQKFHNMLVDGVPIEYKSDSRVKGGQAWLVDFETPENNEFLAVNQFTVIEDRNNRRPDIILFVNGLPLVVIELKNPADEQATIWKAFNQLQTYKKEIPSLMRFNEIMVISDGLGARAGTLTSNKERFMPWKTVNNKEAKKGDIELETMLKGMFNKKTLIDLIRHFIVFEKDRSATEKKLAAYHQYNATNNALDSTIQAIQSDRRAGIVWHTQGSGKSLTMVFYAGKAVLQLDNPTIVVLTDRNDLDDQLFGTFGKCNELLRQKPVQANSRENLKNLLKVSSGGIIFTTVQKFLPNEKGEKYPLLSDRKNIIVIADEAHRSQYDFIDGFARHLRDALPNASFIGFTGTPIEKADRSTPAVFGKYVDIYDIEQSVKDKMTVSIFYEGRMAKLDLKPEERPKIDPEFEEVTEGEESSKKEKLKSKWARLEKIVGSDQRIRRIAKDIVKHFEQRLETIEGKAMIVCMSRRICVKIYEEIVKIKPEWHSTDDNKGFIKVIMTGSASDPLDWQNHIRNKARRKAIGDKFKDTEDSLKMVIVRDMWLTGFDAPSLHSMYTDKPMRGHGLMQAIARVNRVFKDKDGGLIVDYIGIGYELKKALSEYTKSGGKGKPVMDKAEAIALMKEKYEIITAMFHGFDYKKFFKLKPKERVKIIPDAMDHILKQKEGAERFSRYVASLLKAFALSVPSNESLEIKDEVGFFQAVKSAIVKNTTVKSEKETSDVDSAIKQILSKAIISDRVVDIFSAAGLKKPDISILSEEFLDEVKDIPQKNLAFEMLKKLLNDEIKIRMKKRLVEGKSFLELLERSIRKYTNRNIEAAQVIEELIQLAKDMKNADKRGEELKLTEEELAFYDALETNDSAVKVLGNETLRKIAIELTDTIRKNVAIDWTLRESVQAKLRLMVKKILKKYGYPPDKQKRATETVLEQARLICKDWAENG